MAFAYVSAWPRTIAPFTVELRAATRLARLWRETSKRPDGMEILRSAYENFAGKMETADVVEAREVLEGR